MKRTITILLVLLLAGSAVFAQTTRLDAAAPKDARSMAMGGAFVAMSEGYQSLYGNPAAFADKKAELTLISVNPWAYVKPTQANIATFMNVAEPLSLGVAPPIAPLTTLITDNGIGAGVSAGLGWVGKGLGLGLLGGGEAYLSGDSLFGASGTLDAQIAAVVGIGVPLKLGPLLFQVGGDIRPYLRMTGDIIATQLLGSVIGNPDDFDPMTLDVDVGFGLAVDLGAKLELGQLVSVGLAVRDISTNQNYSTSNIGEVLAFLEAGNLPPGAPAPYTMSPNITLGASVTPIPVFLRNLIDVTVTAEIQDPLKVIDEQASLWNLFHVGAEADLLGGLIAVRTGINKGYISVGAGLDLLLMEVNVAIFTEELGKNPGDQGRTGISAEVAIRF